MHRNRDRGFTVVEALVAVAMLGAAGTALAIAFATSSAIRARAQSDAHAAAAVADRMALLARRPCAGRDTGAVRSAGAVSERWTAVRSPAGWAFRVSVTVVGAPASTVVTGEVLCLP